MDYDVYDLLIKSIFVAPYLLHFEKPFDVIQARLQIYTENLILLWLASPRSAVAFPIKLVSGSLEAIIQIQIRFYFCYDRIVHIKRKFSPILVTVPALNRKVHMYTDSGEQEQTQKPNQKLDDVQFRDPSITDDQD